MAEREGFEPPDSCPSTVFKSLTPNYACLFLLICSYRYSQFGILLTDLRLIFMYFYFIRMLFSDVYRLMLFCK